MFALRVCIPGLIQFMFHASRGLSEASQSPKVSVAKSRVAEWSGGANGTLPGQKEREGRTVDGNKAEGVDSKEMQKRDREEARRNGSRVRRGCFYPPHGQLS